MGRAGEPPPGSPVLHSGPLGHLPHSHHLARRFRSSTPVPVGQWGLTHCPCRCSPSPQSRLGGARCQHPPMSRRATRFSATQSQEETLDVGAEPEGWWPPSLRQQQALGPELGDPAAVVGALSQAQRGWPTNTGLCSEPAAPFQPLKPHPDSLPLPHESQWELGQGAQGTVQLSEPAQPFQLQDWGSKSEGSSALAQLASVCEPACFAPLSPKATTLGQKTPDQPSPPVFLVQTSNPDGRNWRLSSPHQAMPQPLLLHSGLCPQAGAYWSLQRAL